MLEALVAESLPALFWSKLVNDTVSEPYLDEVFHVRQAQNYCHGRFNVWDPKITTPPGLYLLSYALSPILGCDLISLRSLGLPCLCGLLIVVLWTYTRRQTGQQNAILNQHSALNITLFPPLFFFSALYYTDVASTLSVLIFYWYFIYSHRIGPRWWHYPILFLLGLTSLMFRQTNIFWVALYPAGITLVDHLDKGHNVVKYSIYRRVEGFGDSVVSLAKTAWKMEVIYDPSVRDAWIEDYSNTLISIAVCACKTLTERKRIIVLLGTLSPYLMLMAIFAAFVIWNGSVVLGDKTNHIATLHLPQMLYIWPYFVFFSWPMVYPYLSALPIGLYAQLSHVAFLESMLIFNRRRLVPRPWLAVTFLAAACVVVRYNTVVHPFTLADNRHYTFYVLKMLMRPWWVKYAVTPIYVMLGWACIQALGARAFNYSNTTQNLPSKDDKLPEMQAEDQAKGLMLPDGNNSATSAFVLIWLATTSLQLITAPLVEPRYLILPWIFWRMHMPLERYRPAQDNSSAQSSRLANSDHRLWLETAWFLVINAATGYIFLKWEFYWPQEPGKVQRFMW